MFHATPSLGRLRLSLIGTSRWGRRGDRASLSRARAAGAARVVQRFIKVKESLPLARKRRSVRIAVDPVIDRLVILRARLRATGREEDVTGALWRQATDLETAHREGLSALPFLLWMAHTTFGDCAAARRGLSHGPRLRRTFACKDLPNRCSTCRRS